MFCIIIFVRNSSDCQNWKFDGRRPELIFLYRKLLSGAAGSSNLSFFFLENQESKNS